MVFMSQRLRIPIYYDFASTLCYVAHRVLGRLAADFDSLGVELEWTPLDLAQLLGMHRGAAVDPRRRANAQRVARELVVDVAVPTHWMDSRLPLAAALTLPSDDRGTAWRERVWSEIYESRRNVDSVEAVERLGRELGLRFDRGALNAAEERVASLTETARHAMVTGVPTLMLGEWPFGGIQERDTMRAVIERFARRRRQGLM